MPVPVLSPLLGGLRTQIAGQLFTRVAGPDADRAHERIHLTEGERWFEAGSPIQEVNGDAAMFVGGIRALLLQSLHPLAMQGVTDHSGYEGDPWGRLQRTSYFLAVTTFGTAADADHAVRAVRSIHERVTGTAPDGTPYAASDPHLLRWVHVAELDSFLAAHRRYGARRLTQEERDTYVAQAARVAEELGVTQPPRSEVELRAQLAAYRPELRATAGARKTARFLLLDPPLPLVARPPYLVLAAAAVGLMPVWARRKLLLPYLPVTERLVVQSMGSALTRTIRWALVPPAA